VQNTAKSATADNPPIHLIDTEYDVIADLALGIERHSPALSKMLLEEIDRAEIHSRETMPSQTVRIGSEVEVLDAKTGTTRHLRLVLPIDADLEAGRVSILTPIGAGLIGLRKGQSINWPYPDGSSRILRILKVTHPKRN
jgi:regulator of nucleoside diphosphate kinase